VNEYETKALATLKTETPALEEYLTAEARTFAVRNDSDLQFAADTLADIKTRQKALVDAQAHITAPIRETERRVRELFKNALQAAEDAKQVWQDKILSYREDQAHTQAAAFERAAAAAAAGDHGGVKTALTVAIEPDAGVPGMQVRKVWKHTVFNKHIVPTEFMEPNDGLIRAEMFRQIKAGGDPVIPGVRFEQVEVLANGR
jgi:hypothetical protein